MTSAGIQDRAIAAGLPAIAAGAGLALCLVWPRATAGAFPAMALVWIAAARPDLGWLREALWGSALARVVAAFVLYLVVNAGLALEPGPALEKAGMAAGFLALALAATQAVPRMTERELTALSRYAAAGATAGALVLAFEVLTEQSLARLLFNAVPVLRPDSGKHMLIEAGSVQSIAAYMLNRNVGVLALIFWPAAFAFRAFGNARVGGGLLAAFAAAAVLAAMLSEHETSKIALVASGLVFAVALAWPRLARWGLTAGWWAAFLLVVPLTLAAYKADWHRADWLPVTGQARIILWSQTAAKVAEAPVMGIGVRSTLAFHNATKTELATPEGHVYPLHTGRHAHNVYLQTWFELGAIGVLFMLALGTLVLRRLTRLPAAMQPYACAQMAAFMTLAGFSWGMWQTWYAAAVGLAAIVTAAVAGGASRRP